MNLILTLRAKKLKNTLF